MPVVAAMAVCCKASHCAPLVQEAQNCSPLVQEHWRAASAPAHLIEGGLIEGGLPTEGTLAHIVVAK